MEDDELSLNPSHFVDNYYRGTIIKVRRGTQSGLLRSAATGRVLPFSLLHMRLVGVERFEDLREGMVVGYDVSWTEHGRRVSVLRVSGAAVPQPPPPVVPPSA